MNNGAKNGNTGPKPMTQSAAVRIQSATARHTGGAVPKDSFAARAQSAAARHAGDSKNGK